LIRSFNKLAKWLKRKTLWRSFSQATPTRSELSVLRKAKEVTRVNKLPLKPMVELDEQRLQVLLNRAATDGAREALKQVGLGDPEAGKDIHDLRNLLDDFRSAKRTISKTILKSITVAILGAIAAATWLNYGPPK